MDPALVAFDFAKAGAILADMVEILSCRRRPAIRSGGTR